MNDHPTFIIYVDQLPNYEPGQTAGYVLSDEVARIVKSLVVKGHKIYITTKRFEFPPMFESCLLYTGHNVLLLDEYNNEHVYIMQYYRDEYTNDQLKFIRYMMDDIYQVGSDYSGYRKTDLVDKGVFEPTPKSFPINTQTSTEPHETVMQNELNE